MNGFHSASFFSERKRNIAKNEEEERRGRAEAWGVRGKRGGKNEKERQQRKWRALCHLGETWGV